MRDGVSVRGRVGALAEFRTSRWVVPCDALIAFAPIVLVCALQAPMYPMSPDEQMQALYASGRYLASGPNWLMPYSLAPISVPLSLLYRLLPQLPWYPLMLLILIGASWSISLIQVMRSRMNDPLCLSLVTIFLACDVISTMYLTFTIVSFLTVSAGLMLLVGRSAFARDPRVHASDVVGLVLIVLGYALRPESGQVAFVLFSPFALWVLAANRNVASISRMFAAVLGVALCVGVGQAAYRSTPGWETYPDYLAAGRRSLDYPDLPVEEVRAIAPVALCVGVGQAAYRSTPGWETYPDYLAAGRRSLDYPDLPVEEVRAIAPELSEEDVALLHEWMFIDEDVFGIDFFSRYGEAREHISLDNARDALGAKTTYALIGLTAAMAACAWALTGDIGRRDGVCLLAFGVVLMLLVSCALLILRARVRVHVVMPLAFCAMMSLVMCAHAPVASSIGVHARVSERGGSRGSRGMALPIAALLFSVVACGGFWAVVVRPLRAQAAAPTVAAVADYVEENPDQLVVFARTQTLLYPSYDAFSFERWSYPENVLQVGGWMSHTAPWRDFLERHDLSLGSTFADSDTAVPFVRCLFIRALVLSRERVAGRRMDEPYRAVARFPRAS